MKADVSRDPLLWWAGGAFALMLAAWAAFFIIASHNKVEEVPLQSRPAEGNPP